jgi:ketosteroid isomerase-like protein
MRTATSLRSLFLASVLIAAAVAPVVAQTAKDGEPLAKAAVAAFHEALNAGNAEAAMRLLAPDAVVMEGGDLETRKQYQDHHLAADIQFARSVKTVRSGIFATVVGEVAWVSSTSVTVASYNGRDINLNGAELMVLSKAPTGWLIRAIHWSSHERN